MDDVHRSNNKEKKQFIEGNYFNSDYIFFWSKYSLFGLK